MRYLKMLIVGAAGNGKTYTAYSATLVPELCPVLAINIGGNPISAKSYDPTKYKIFDIVTEADFTELGDFLFGGQKDAAFIKKHKLESYGKFKTVIIDGISEYNRRMAAGLAGFNQLKFGQVPRNNNSLQDYGFLNNAVLEFCFQAYNMVEDLGLHVIVTALEEEVDGEIVISVLGQVKYKIAAYPEIVINVTQFSRIDPAIKGEIEKLCKAQDVPFNEDLIVARIKPSQKVGFTKCQIGKPPSKYPTLMMAPTIQKFYNLINEG